MKKTKSQPRVKQKGKPMPKKKEKAVKQVSSAKESLFRGFEIADSTIERKNLPCSQCVAESCGLRDCKLQVFNIGEEKVLSGGLCPKGNTHPSQRRAPNYVELYKSILSRHLNEVSFAIGDLSESKRKRVFMPRSLTFLNERGVYFATLYDALGFDVVLSPESDDEIAQLGKTYAHSESCYPVILAHGHAAYLMKHLRPGIDKIFLANVIRAENLKLTFCPYVSSAGFVIKGNLGLSQTDVLMPLFFFDSIKNPVEGYILKDLQRVFGKGMFSLSQVRNAITLAQQHQKSFLDEVYSKGNSLVKDLTKRHEPIFIGIGRGYTILDKKASSKVDDLFATQGLHFIPTLFFSYDSIDEAPFAENMYWYQGKRMIQANVGVALHPRMFPVRLTNFNCGPDSMLLAHEEDIMRKAGKPHLVLETDGHNSNAQFGTRIAANYEVVRMYKEHKVTLASLKDIPITPTHVENRIIGLPNMGDSSYVVAAAFRAAGLKSEVMPTWTTESISFAKKYVSTNTCRPFSFQVGDALAWFSSLQKRGIDPNLSAATFLPKSCGPCRFGQYSVVLRKIFDRAGFQGVPILDPSDREGYQNLALPKDKITLISALAFKGMVANDILLNALLRTRPYEKERGLAETIYREAHAKLVTLLESNVSLGELAGMMKSYATRFQNACKDVPRKPIVLMIGEIFIRCNEASNEDSIKVLERHGLEVILEPSSAWVDYINRGGVRDSWREKDYQRLTLFLIKQTVMDQIFKRLYKPYKSYLEGRKPHNSLHLIDAAEKDQVYSYDVRGEGSISIGTLYAFLHGELSVDGVYQVGPFGCMQETVATSRIQALLNERLSSSSEPQESLMPYLYAVFGESKLSNLDAEIALFAENCRLRKSLSKPRE